MDKFLQRGIPGEAGGLLLRGVPGESICWYELLAKSGLVLPRGVPRESTQLLRVGHGC